jgi:NADPH:quinone reductase-like Zn-dependent oxidoreductase
MRAWMIDAFGAPLLARDVPEPIAGPGQVVVDVEAVSLNYRDLLVLGGTYDARAKLPLVPCSDAAGTVVAAGPGATVPVGARVTTVFAPGWLDGPPTAAGLRSTFAPPAPGVLAERIVVPEAAVVGAPPHLDAVGASTLPCAALTAWNALFEAGSVGPGDAVLVLGSGGVSVFAAQLALAAGARVAMTSSSDDKLARAAALGVGFGVRYDRDPKWGRAAKAWAGGEGVDHVIEVGGVGTLAGSLSAVRPGGTISLIGVLAGSSAPVDLTSALMRGVRIQGVFVGSRRMHERMVASMTASSLRPVVDLVVPFDEAPSAFEALRAARHFGKVVIRRG